MISSSPTSAFRSFFGDVIGLVRGEATIDGSDTWRNDDAAQRVIVETGPANDAKYFGLVANDLDAFEVTSERLARAGFELTEGTDAEMAARRVSHLRYLITPWGVRMELTSGLARAATSFASPLVRGGFLTGEMGFGHVVFATTAFDESDRFLVEGLGLAQSDWIETDIAEGIQLEVRFYHCNTRHHSVALARAPFELPQTLHHMMFETNDRDDVGSAFDRVWDTKLIVANGLGRHDNDGMFSFYVVSPAGFLVEVGYGARMITDDWRENRRYDRISVWGHQPLAHV